MCQCDTDAPARAIVWEKKSHRYDLFINTMYCKNFAGNATCQYADIYNRVFQVPLFILVIRNINKILT